MEILQCDVLVIGGGSAGARAVVAAQRYPVKVVLAMKGKIGKSGASTYVVTEAAGYGAADGRRDPADSPQVHFDDIIKAGRGMCIPEVVRTLTAKAPKTIRELEEFGVVFEHENDRYLITQGCFGSIPRNYNIKGHGSQIVRALANKFKPDSLTLCDDCMVTELIEEDNRCFGAIGIRGNGQQVAILATTTILTSGGAGRLFKYSLNPEDITGDSYALAYRAGAELMNMEFMQVGCGILHPGFSILNSWIWSLLPNVYDSRGNSIFTGRLPSDTTKDAVMEAKSTHYPFSSESLSKYVEICIQNAMVDGRGGAHGGIYLDVKETLARNHGKKGLQLFEDMWKITNEWYLSRGIDVSVAPIEIACFAHAINGGVKIDASARSSVSGLYAAGEASSGPHGADRLGGNMLVTCMVFGEISGENAAFEALEGKNRRGAPRSSIDEAISRQGKALSGSSGASIRDIAKSLQDTMWRSMMVVRTEKKLAECLQKLVELKHEAAGASRDGSSLFAPFELDNMLLTSRIMTESARARRESRGSHYREDYPYSSESFSEPLVVSRRLRQHDMEA